MNYACRLARFIPVHSADFQVISKQSGHENRPLSVPFLAQECASPPAFAVKALHFAPMNAKPAALTARAAKRRRPPRRAFASFFQAEITPEKRKKEGTKC